MLQDPKVKKYYAKIAKKRKQPNAYTAAMSDQLKAKNKSAKLFPLAEKKPATNPKKRERIDLDDLIVSTSVIECTRQLRLAITKATELLEVIYASQRGQ